MRVMGRTRMGEDPKVKRPTDSFFGFTAAAGVVLLSMCHAATAEPSRDRIVAVRAVDGLIQIIDADGKVERSFGGSVTGSARDATPRPPNFRVAVGDVLGSGSLQIITAVADHLDPCRLLYDPHSGKRIDLGWSREGRYALDVAISRSGALTINEKRGADGQAISSYWNCYDVGNNQRLFHTEFGVEVVAIAAGELVSESPSDEVATIHRDGRIEAWDSAKRAHDPVVLLCVDNAGIRHVDLVVADVDQRNPGNEIVASDIEGRLHIYSADGRPLQTLKLDEPVSSVAAGDVTRLVGQEILAVSRMTGDVLIIGDGGILPPKLSAGSPGHKLVGRVKADRAKPFVDVATIGPIKPLGLPERHLSTPFGPVSEIRRGESGDLPWRVELLTFANGGEGLFRAYNCLFTIPNYWPYGVFSSQSRCELPGKQFVARASGRPGDNHHLMTPGFWGEVNRYRMVDGRFYVAWRMRPPERFVQGGRFADVMPAPGPWEVWCNANSAGGVTWTVRALRDGEWVDEHVSANSETVDWINVQIVAEPRQIILQINQAERLRMAHDTYREPFHLRFGSRQSQLGGGEVVTRFREVYVSDQPYPWPGERFAEGPEDVRREDDAIVGYLKKATPQAPRSSEGDMIVTKDGHLLAVYSYYYDGKGHDGSPARLVGSLSKDGGRTWIQPWIVADRDEGSQGNVMSASLLRANNGDLLLAYYDRTPEMPAKGMVLRRSADEGKTWSGRIVVTPRNGNRHVANNACLTRLSKKRIVLAAREYIDGIRWPYACYSDDDGRTWKAGKRVPDPGLTPSQKRGQNVNEPSICELAGGRLLMTMRSVAGGQFFSWSDDAGETWSKPVLSPLRGQCSPAILRRIPGSEDILAVWTYGFAGRTPLVSAISSDGGQTWKHLKLLEQSRYHGYCYASCIFQEDRVHLAYMHFPMFSSRFRFEADPGYIDYRFVSLPLSWFYRDEEKH